MSEDNIITTPDVAIKPTQSMGWFMFTNMKKHKDNIAQVPPNPLTHNSSKTFFVSTDRCQNRPKRHIRTTSTTLHPNSPTHVG